MLLFADISGLICKDDSVKATFRVNNLDRKPVSVEGSYRLFLISDYQKSKPLKEQDVSDQPALSVRLGPMKRSCSPIGKNFLQVLTNL